MGHRLLKLHFWIPLDDRSGIQNVDFNHLCPVMCCGRYPERGKWLSVPRCMLQAVSGKQKSVICALQVDHRQYRAAL